jgi:putative molybdopterin biosynthesis protein
LRFIPLVEENYFLACLAPNIEHPAVQRLRAVLAGARWRDILVSLSGYRPPTAPGAVLAVEEALPSWWRRTKRATSPPLARTNTTPRGVVRPTST